MLALSLVVYFNKNTAERLKKLMENTLKIGRREQVSPVLVGADELAHLDSTICRMSEELELAVKKERAVLDNASDIICSIDSLGKFAAVNPASKEVLGYEPSELVGKTLVRFVHPTSLQATERALTLAIQDKSRSSFENQMKHRDGSTLDLRTPLTAIKVMHSSLIRGVYGQIPAGAGEKLNSASAELARLISLINDLLDVERMESGKLEMVIQKVPIQGVFDQTIVAVGAIAEEAQVALLVNHCEEAVRADDRRLVQVMVNLVGNAIKFSSTGSTVEIGARRQQNSLRVEVRDTGRGIPESKLSSIFDQFSQVEAADASVKGGSGLGLAICKAIIEQLDGKIGVDSKENAGSTFWFVLPVFDEM